LYNGSTEKAKKYFKEGIKLDPGNTKCMLAFKNAQTCEELKGINIIIIIIKFRKRKYSTKE
jgi:hypothetical protein